ncbi:MAG: methylenetetrahydrofolate--tRNA-(uracil(54)-C(5))-methyltransferase (FADH(2)-oxidizing) TrmFO [Syntrophomonadaceae bacterium]|nr:methylenetetrahydrofolate--tRNA-(uracil(54)-C(5))-methyltransferase (FADH(2)-oxidizing) TrmFO [Syntrophomonadaceae bacterium]
MMQQIINVIGGGLAGCEAAMRIANQGIRVKLWEMRPKRRTAVHKTSNLAELVCSNSLKSELETTAQGLLKREMRELDSLLLACAESARVPAGSALAVDPGKFSSLVTKLILENPRIEVVREEVLNLPKDEYCIIASGPLTSPGLAQTLQEETGEENLYFYDAVAPSVTLDSIDMNRVYKASRYNKGTPDYYNCPLNKEQYDNFVDCLVNADIKEGHSVDNSLFFQACMPIEVMARKGRDALRFGPMRPVGLSDPGSREKPYAVVQLRQEDQAGNIFGLVGFQTRLLWGEQDKIIRMIPGLERAEFVRYGVMHRNTYLNSPKILLPTLQFKTLPRWFFAGQITGVEGYMESAATGIIAGINAVRCIQNQKPLVPSQYTMIGALIGFITSAAGNNFQPINANFGILPPMETRIRDKRCRYQAYVERAMLEIIRFKNLVISCN